MSYTLILIIASALGVFAMIAALISRYKRCPSDQLLVVYGRTGKAADGKSSTASVYHGGGTFIWPIIQDYSFLSLRPMSIDVNLEKALSKQNIRVDVPATFTIAISTEPKTMINAAERLLGMNSHDISALAKEIILGQLRLVIAIMNIEEINSDRDKFLEAIQHNLEAELDKVGLRLINVNITDIKDESGYIAALGKEAAAKALNDAKISVAEKTRDGDIGSGAAEKERNIKTAELTAQGQVGMADAKASAEIGQADATARQRSKVAELNAKAVEGENTAAVAIANTSSLRKVAEAEATRKAVTAEKVAVAVADKDSYEAQQKAETARAEKDKATLYANEIVPAQIEKDRVVIDAQAEASRIREIAKGNADGVFLEKEAQAKGAKEILVKQAEGFAELVKASGGPEYAVQLMIADKLPELMRIQVSAIQNLKIDAITVWENGGGDGKSSTGNLINGLLTALPGFSDVYRMAGKELPEMLRVGGKEAVRPQESIGGTPLNEGNDKGE